ncbi:hypothetical protein KI688_004175 [Linnemannia hyalina]|uniref:3'-5' exonuclease domain-containing protein n=1 Tax=Linnemannia hyalina TaxID=64524 RepID=A0A9P8BPL7_9FUNG|nr:hypothetical protein KI688_004175 [Linnemannia hyalina]
MLTCLKATIHIPVSAAATATTTSAPLLPISIPAPKKLSKKTLKASKLKLKYKAKASISTDPLPFTKPPPPQPQPSQHSLDEFISAVKKPKKSALSKETIVTVKKSRDPTPLPTSKQSKVKNSKVSKSAATAPQQAQEGLSSSSTAPGFQTRTAFKRDQKKKHRIQPHKKERAPSFHKKFTSTPPGFDDGTTMSANETMSDQVQILCEAFAEANIRRVRQYPPVFLIGTYEHAELAMQIFTEYYELTTQGLGHVGFDTETECHWDNPAAQRDEVSIIQMASQDICLLFQINRIVNVARCPFPSRLKAFLEDPTHLKLGVGAKRDAKDLDRIFNIDCDGVVDLEVMALEKKVLERSLQDLDEKYGRPGREVLKTHAMLRWKWNAVELQPQWVWYAAKDAFAGIAIYENMMADRVKDTFKPYEERFPMTDKELKRDIMTFLERAMGGKGRQTTLGAVETTLQKGYGRFQKMYQPKERNAQVKELVRQLITDNRLTRVAQTPLTAANKDDVLIITGERLERVLRTQEAIDVLRPYFNNSPVYIHSLSTKGITLPRTLDNSAGSAVDENYEDLRLFVELGSMWQQPRKLNGMTSSFLFELEAAGYHGLPPVAKSEPGYKLPEKKIVQANMERAKANDVGSKWRAYVNRLVRRRVLVMESGLYMMDHDLEDRCREAAPELPREIVDPAENKRQKALRRTAITEGRLSTVKDLTNAEDWGHGAQKRVRLVPDEGDDDVAEVENDNEQEDEEMVAAAI